MVGCFVVWTRLLIQLLNEISWLDVVRLKEGWLGVDLDVMCSSSLFRLIGLKLIRLNLLCFLDWTWLDMTGLDWTGLDLLIAKGKVTKTCTTSASNTICVSFPNQTCIQLSFPLSEFNSVIFQSNWAQPKLRQYFKNKSDPAQLKKSNPIKRAQNQYEGYRNPVSATPCVLIKDDPMVWFGWSVDFNSGLRGFD